MCAWLILNSRSVRFSAEQAHTPGTVDGPFAVTHVLYGGHEAWPEQVDSVPTGSVTVGSRPVPGVSLDLESEFTKTVLKAVDLWS